MKLSRRLTPLLVAPLLGACSSTPKPPPGDDPTPAETCKLASATFEVGDANGHPDPLGAKAAGQARAGRIKDASTFPQPAHGRQRIQTGDLVLANDSIAVVIENTGLSDGYARFGGEILAIDKIGDDGKPLGLSRYVETLMGVAFQMPNPTSVTVINDGSDGAAAVVRAAGPLETIPFLDGPLKGLFPASYELEAAFDYVLAPGSSMLTIRVGLINPTLEAIDFGVDRPSSDEYYGFFQYSQSQLVTAEHGYGKQSGVAEWAGFDSGAWNFAWRTTGDPPLEFGIEQSGFQLYFGRGFVIPACATTFVDRVQVIAGGPDYDGLRESIRKESGETAWRAVTGTLKDAKGTPVGGAWIHGVGAAGQYLTRTRTSAAGAFTVHAPPGETITIVPQKRGYPPHDGAVTAADATDVALTFQANATLHIVATDLTAKTPVPVRIQVIPTKQLPATPDAFGVDDEQEDRLHQEFATTGEATLTVPPGEHRIVVSRGYEWEIFDTTVVATAGETLEIAAPMEHSVDTTGVMCADFHIHSSFSADSNDSPLHKVKGAIADGLDIPVSSEHEWVIDFQPIVESLGMTAWAFGMPSEELTTFTWGHFGVVPVTPRPGTLNNGAMDWIGLNPGQVFDNVHALPEKPALIVNHPRGGGFGGYFSASLFDRKLFSGDPLLWSDHFDAIEVFNDSDFESNRDESVADWFAFLNRGTRMIAIGSSDSHHLRSSPVGYPRTCLYFGHDTPAILTASAVRDVIKSGASTISGGLYMTVEGPGGERPGDTVEAPGGVATFTVTVEAPSFIAADTLETIVGGTTVSVEPLLPLGGGPSKKFVNQVNVALPSSAKAGWVVFHAKGEADLAPLHPGRQPFAVSNAVFLKVP